MNIRRLNVENSSAAVRCHTACLLCNKGQRIRFIEKPQFSLWIDFSGRVQEDTAFQHRSMKVGHQGTDVAGTVAPSQSSRTKACQIIAILIWKRVGLSFVHRVVQSLFRHLQVVVTKYISPDCGIERKAEDTVSRGVDQNG